MAFTTLFFATAAGWFTLIVLRIGSWIYQFSTYAATFGRTTNVSLDDLAALAAGRDRDLPAFNIVVPAYQEALVIDGTLRRMAAINYPRTHFNVWVMTYEDEPREPGQDSTFAAASAMAGEINGQAGREMVRVVSVPASFDGRFPGTLGAAERFIGKPRGLNFALRTIHEENERDERRLYAGRMVRLGHADLVDGATLALEDAMRAGPDAFAREAARHFDPLADSFAGPCAFSSQLFALQDVLSEAIARYGTGDEAVKRLAAHVEAEAPRFFLTLSWEAGSGPHDARAVLSVMEDRRFLYDAMRGAEAAGDAALAQASRDIEARLSVERPHLWRALQRTRDGEALYQLARRANPRWMAVYDADADAPVDLLRHLSARILTEPETLGFQGPVAPVANYGDVHPLCKIGGMYMAFWHHTGYPRLFARRNWAHVLAGTNWCFRIDAFRSGDRLLRETPYDERARTFILSFDPGHLTEDLEVAVRMFDEWKVNAQWHPCLEYEQVPASRKAMVVQRRRWSLGTLHTIAFMLRSRLPAMQKVKYGLRPVDIALSGSGPIVSILLWIFIYAGELLNEPAIIAWSVFLTFANLVYVIPYLQTHAHFVAGFRRATGVEYLIEAGPRLAAAVGARLNAGPVSEAEARLLHDISTRLDEGLRPRGFIRRYLATRCVDPAPPTAGTRALAAATPVLLTGNTLPDLARTFSGLTQRAYAHASSGDPVDAGLAERLSALKSALDKAAGTGPWKIRRRREIRQIWLWAFVYLFWQLVPAYLALKDWLTGSERKTWVKTPRTRKSNLGTAA